MMNTVVLDNGASSIKAIGPGSGSSPRRISNAIIRSKGDRKTYVADEFASCRDFSGLYYRIPFERGMLTSWEAQKVIWDRVFSKPVLNVDPSSTSLVITEPYFNLPNLQEGYDQMVFEEYEFQSYYRCTPASLIPFSPVFEPSLSNAQRVARRPECMLVVDSGFSYTHVVPIIKDAVVWEGVKRIDVGGKLLTNYLKEVVSFRQWNMMDQNHVINHVKEACCYVSSDFARDLETCKASPKRNAIVQEYVLPDFSPSNRTGYVRRGPPASSTSAISAVRPPPDHNEADDQVLCMDNERFSIPELLFRPSDIGLEQAGLPEAIARSISCLPEEIRGLFWNNVVLIGGNSLFTGFKDRLEQELRPLAPSGLPLHIYVSDDPISLPALGGASLSTTAGLRDLFRSRLVTRAEYLELGSEACRRKFGGPAASVMSKAGHGEYDDGDGRSSDGMEGIEEEVQRRGEGKGARDKRAASRRQKR